MNPEKKDWKRFQMTARKRKRNRTWFIVVDEHWVVISIDGFYQCEWDERETDFLTTWMDFDDDDDDNLLYFQFELQS